MEKKHIISLAGELSSGKSTVAKILKEDLNYEIYRNGEYFRNLAKKHGMDLTEFNVYVSKHPEIDIQIENRATEYAKTHDNFIIDARLGWYSIPQSFKVYLKVNIDVAAERAFNDQGRKSSENYSSVEEQKKKIIERYNSENERYWNIYGVKRDDMSNYDLVLDTTSIKPEEVAKIIKTEYSKWLEK